jgi:hypothetical protein
MKTVILAAFMFTCAFATAQDNIKQNKNAPGIDKNSSYCMALKGDALVLMKDGKQVFNDIKLEDGTRITANGSIITPDGIERKLKENECADLDGKITKPVLEVSR